MVVLALLNELLILSAALVGPWFNSVISTYSFVHCGYHSNKHVRKGGG